MERFESFVSYITELHRLIQRLKNSQTAHLGLEGKHVMVLNYLRANPEGLTGAELCALCGEDKAAISRTLADLESRGLIDRQHGYRAKICLTDEGLSLAEKVKELSDHVVEAGGAGLTDEQRQNLYFALDTITKNLEKLC